MTVGEALTEARHAAGLSVDELSERTRIRASVIRSIEQDDYRACGGDLYVRGYVRALAGALGTDAQPLIRAYDRQQASGEVIAAVPDAVPAPVPAAGAGPTADPASELGGAPAGDTGSPASAAAADQAPTAFDMPVMSGAPQASAPADAGQLDETRVDLPVIPANPAATAYDMPTVGQAPPTVQVPVPGPPGPVPGTPPQPVDGQRTRFDLAAAPTDLMAAGYDFAQPVPAGQDAATAVIPLAGVSQGGPVPGPPRNGSGRGKRRGLAVLAAVAALAVIVVLGARLASGGTATTDTAASGVPTESASSASSAAEPSESPSPQPSPSASAKPSRSVAAKIHPVTLSVASVAAYGPEGLADGDHPANASQAIARDPEQPWTSDWYVTARFGLLKHGTGLLLNLGGKVKITSIRLELSQYRGSDLQIRVGYSKAFSDLRVVATTNNAAGTVKLSLRQPTTARYLLIWFTELPPDGAGHYQASVSHVVVTGQR